MFARLFVSLAATVGLAISTASAQLPGPLVSVDWLAENLDNDDLVVVDIRSGIDGSTRETFEAGQIPGSVYSSYTEAGWRQSREGVVGMLPEVESLEQLIGALGIDNGTDVVIVPAGVGSTDFGSAARIYWTFKVLGHDRVAILNGGYSAWTAAGQAVAQGAVVPEAREFTAGFRPELLATAESVANAPAAGIQLVDNRPLEQFAGEDKHPQARAAGTIPGALNLPESQLTREGTAFILDGDAIRQLMAQAEIDTDTRAITFCNTGHWAALGWFAMSEVAGVPDVAMYDGSMVDWAQDENRPLQIARSGLGGLIDRLFN